MPRISASFSYDLEPVERIKNTKYRVGVLLGCIMSVAYAHVHRDTIALLRQAGCDVVIPEGQTCCGSLHAHNGDGEFAISLARQNIKAFGNAKLDAIIVNSAGCGAYMKKYATSEEEEGSIGKKIKDLTEFLSDVGFAPNVRIEEHAFMGKRVTWHDPCHLAHAQKIVDEPRRLLGSIPGIEFVALPESSWCCGSAGVYNIVRFEDAHLLLERKIRNILSVNPDVVVTANPGCEAQIAYGLRKAEMKVETMHIASFLARVYGAA
jgi:glycolate oxidase iron-sulfur subunit